MDINLCSDFQYIAFIDEAGDLNTNRVRPIDETGGSEWFVMSAVLIRRHNLSNIHTWQTDILRHLSITQTKFIHFKNLNDRQKLHSCQYLSNLPIRIFVIVSNKRTLRGHDNPRAASKGSKQWYYNWIARMLLERVSDYVGRRSLKDYGVKKLLKVIFSQAGRHSYAQTTAYHELLGYQSRSRSVYLPYRSPDYDVINRHSFDAYHSKSIPALQFADITASAFYAAADNLDTGPCISSYAIALEPRVAFDHQGKHANYGLVFQPTPSHPLQVPADQQTVFRHYGYRFNELGVIEWPD